MAKKSDSNDNFKILTITGTKGKTTIVRALEKILLDLGFKTLRVDTDGHFVNGKQKSDYADSRKYWGIVPNNCPGRYLYELRKMPLERTAVIFEAAIGSSSLFGMGYSSHDIGALTNIYEDHITKRRIKNRNDIYAAKRFIFLKLKSDGVFVYNHDDSFLRKKIAREDIEQRKIIISKYISDQECRGILKEDPDNVVIKIHQGFYEIKDRKGKIAQLDFRQLPIAFGGKFEPNVYNIAFVLGFLLAFLGKNQFGHSFSKIKESLESYVPSKEGGRQVVLDSRKGAKIIIDFAHEKESFKQIALLARNFSSGKVIGVLRIDPSRIDEDILKTAKSISKYFDFIYIYDKVDGVNLKESLGKAEGKKRGVGETAEVFSEGLKKSGFNDYKIILEEQKAFLEAYKNAGKNDTIVFIGNGYDHKKTYNFTKKIINQE